MFRLPLFVVYAMIAFNITAFTLILQLNMLIFNSIYIKILCWILTIAAWGVTYIKRNKFITLF